MKYLFVILMISMFIVGGCSNNESVKDLKLENERLKQENEKLSEVKEELESYKSIEVSVKLAQEKIDRLNLELRTSQAETEYQKETIKRYQEAFELLDTETNAIANKLSIFSLEQVKKGNRIAGLTVYRAGKETVNESTNYFVKFTGEFQVKGSIVHNVFGGSKYSFIVKENLERIPHTIEQFEKGSVYFDIKNEKELTKVLGNKLEELPEDGELEIEGVFKNYSYNYVPETEFPSFAEFVSLKSED